MKRVKEFYNYLKFKNEFYNLVLTPEERKILKDYNRQQNGYLGLKITCLTVWTLVFLFLVLLIIKIMTANYKPIIIEREQTIVENIIPINYKKEITIEEAANYAKTRNAKRITEVAFQMKEKYNLPLYIIFSIIDTESEFYRVANSRIGKENGRGLMQVSEVCLKDFNNKSGEKIRTKDELYYIYVNMNIGCWYYSRLYNLKAINNYDEAYVAYNVGIGNFQKYKNKYLNNKLPDNSSYNALKRFRQKENYYYDLFSGL